MPASMWLGYRYREQARSHNGPGSEHETHEHPRSLVGASLLAMRWHIQHHRKLTLRLREQARSHRRNAVTQNQVGYQAASRWTLISGAPLTTMAERRHCAVGIPAWMPG